MCLRVNEDLVCFIDGRKAGMALHDVFAYGHFGQVIVGAIGQANAVLAISRVIFEKVAQLLCFYLKRSSLRAARLIIA